jgi:hypothetical protein
VKGDAAPFDVDSRLIPATRSGSVQEAVENNDENNQSNRDGHGRNEYAAVSKKYLVYEDLIGLVRVQISKEKYSSSS